MATPEELASTATKATTSRAKRKINSENVGIESSDDGDVTEEYLRRRLKISSGTVKNRTNPKSRHYDPKFPKPFSIAPPGAKRRINRWNRQRFEDYVRALEEASLPQE